MKNRYHLTHPNNSPPTNPSLTHQHLPVGGGVALALPITNRLYPHRLSFHRGWKQLRRGYYLRFSLTGPLFKTPSVYRPDNSCNLACSSLFITWLEAVSDSLIASNWFSRANIRGKKQTVDQVCFQQG
jgi:hypothetical protein